jgi:CRP-like cAMP-binding protein
MDAKLEAMRSVPLFANLSRSHLERVASIADEIDLAAGRTMTTEGDRGREAFVILEGHAEVTREGEPVALVGRGDVVGEIAVVSDVPRTATVKATSDVRALVLTDRDFRRLLEDEPEIGEAVRRVAAERAES